MYPVDLFSTEVRVTWRATLLKGSPWSSRHFAMAVIVNLMNVIQFWTMYKFHTGGHYWSAFIVVLAFVYAMLDYYAVLLYRQTRDWLKMLPEESKEAHQLLQLSYIGYRLYLVGMGTGFLVLSYFNLIRR